MGTAYRSTTLKLVASHCPRALDHYEARDPYDREIFAPGIAAHAVLQVVGDELKRNPAADVGAIADAVVHEIVTRGRSFEGEAEPPMSADAAVAGRDLALAYLSMTALSPTARYEQGLAVNARWEPVAYDAPDVHYRAALDVLDTIEEEDDDGYVTRTLVVRDYKSAWPTDAAELDTIQLRGQAAIAAAHHPDVAVVRRAVVNLRTRQEFAVDLVLDDAGLAQLAQWRNDIDVQIAAAEARGEDGRRPARPGATCQGCPYLLRCEDARTYLRDTILEDVDAAGLALRLAVAQAFRDELYPLAKEAAKEAPIAIEGGVVGFIEKAEREPTEEFAFRLAYAWFQPPDMDEWAANHGDTLGLLQALAPGVTALDRVAKTLHKGRGSKEAREQLLAHLTTSRPVAKFGIHRSKDQ